MWSNVRFVGRKRCLETVRRGSQHIWLQRPDNNSRSRKRYFQDTTASSRGRNETSATTLKKENKSENAEISTFMAMTPLEAVQSNLLAAHSALGGPWWSTLVVVTLGFRCALIPITVMQMRTMNALSSGPVGKHLSLLGKLYSNDLKKNPEDRAKLTKMYVQGYRKIFKLFDVNPFKVIAVPLTQIAFLATYIVATRDLITSGAIDLSDQGLFWFANLADRDPTLILPMAAVGLTYTSLEYSFGRTVLKPDEPVTLRFGDVVREVFQSILVFSVPLIAQLPAGVFMYWIPSSLFGMAQTFALRQPGVRSALGLNQPVASPKPVKVKQVGNKSQTPSLVLKKRS